MPPWHVNNLSSIPEPLYPELMAINGSNPKIIPADIAQWMLAYIEEHGELTQNAAYYEINKQFGTGFTTVTNSGSPSIKGSVLTAFKNLTADTIVWERGEKKWRKREFYDAPGRDQF